MRIHVDFDNCNEFFEFLAEANAKGIGRSSGAASEKVQEPAPSEDVKRSDPEPELAKPEKPVEPEPAPVKPARPAEPEPAPVKPEKPAVTVTEVRKIMTKLNKSVGRNVAKELIAKRGAGSLTEVKPEDLPGLKEEAEEMLNA